MNPAKKLQIVALAALSLVMASLCSAQSDAPYTEGPVWLVTMVKTKPGMGDDYLKSLAQTVKLTNDEAKKQGIIMDYKILLGDASDEHDYNIRIEVREILGTKRMREITLK